MEEKLVEQKIEDFKETVKDIEKAIEDYVSTMKTMKFESPLEKTVYEHRLSNMRESLSIVKAFKGMVIVFNSQEKLNESVANVLETLTKKESPSTNEIKDLKKDLGELKKHSKNLEWIESYFKRQSTTSAD